MSIDSKTVTKLGKLSRIRIEDAALEGWAKQISSILGWIEQLSEVPTDGVPELTSVSEVTLPRRKDEITDGNCRDDILKNAPESEYGCFVVPKVIE